ncbi:MAG: hypothetical protein HY729_05105 [Candidatus Rokubacteria bacterium]|nr:hypothetical protein [Candidatus Rokubacteria bacterium]
MPSRRPLLDGSPRLLPNNNSVEGRSYRQAYRVLVADLGPLDTPLLRLEAGRVAVAFVNYEAATRALMEARQLRRQGRGRRPSPRDVERLSRRQGLADQTYTSALDRLRELAKSNGHGRSFAERLLAVPPVAQERAP